MATYPSTIFIAYEPASEHGGMIAPFATEAYATEFYEELIADSLANLGIGLYVARLDNLTAEQAEVILSCDKVLTRPILESEFEGFTITTIKAYEATYDSWRPDAFTVENKDFGESGEPYRITK